MGGNEWYHTLGTDGIFRSFMGMPIMKPSCGSSLGRSSYLRVSVYTVMAMQLNAEKKPATHARPNDQPSTLMSQRGIHVRSTPIIVANTTTETAMHAAENNRLNKKYSRISVGKGKNLKRAYFWTLLKCRQPSGFACFHSLLQREEILQVQETRRRSRTSWAFARRWTKLKTRQEGIFFRIFKNI